MKRGAAAKRQVKELLQTELPTIYRLALDLAKDPKVAPSARAKLISDLFRAAGLYAEEEEAGGKEAHEMTAAELQREVEALQEQLGRRTPNIMD